MNAWANRISLILTVGLVAGAVLLGSALRPKPETRDTRARAERRAPSAAAAAKAAGPAAGRWLEAVSGVAAVAARGTGRAIEAAGAGAGAAGAWIASAAPMTFAVAADLAAGLAAWVVAPLVMIAFLSLRRLAHRSGRSRARVLGLARRGGTAASIGRRLAIPQDAVRALMRPDAPERVR